MLFETKNVLFVKAGDVVSLKFTRLSVIERTPRPDGETNEMVIYTDGEVILDKTAAGEGPKHG